MTDNSQPPTNSDGLTNFESLNSSLDQLLDLDTWAQGNDADALYRQLEATEQIIREAVTLETTYASNTRALVENHFRKNRPVSGAGYYQVKASQIRDVQRRLLFNGSVEACDGTRVTHDALPVTVNQVGVSLVSYHGQNGAWVHRIFRRDFPSQNPTPEEVIRLLERRMRREAVGAESSNAVSRLTSRGIMDYAERAVLKDKSKALWRMGHGNPAPYELLTGLWTVSLARLRKSLDLISWFVERHRRFVFVPSTTRRRDWLSIGGTLRPLEFVIIDSLQAEIENMVDSGGYSAGTYDAMLTFANDIASQIVVGAFRVWDKSPPCLFYAHRDHAQIAALIAMADASLQLHRGFPMLLDLADILCRTAFGPSAFTASIQNAYAQAGVPFNYLGERETRRS